MNNRNIIASGRVAVLALAIFSTNALPQNTNLISGQNVNMVSGTTWPDGDPFLQRQNEPSIAVSSRNALHLLAGSNDYRTVDLPGLVDGKTIGESWVSYYRSALGGSRWISTLLPGYPQDGSPLGMASPLQQNGYEASADPVVRSGTHGLFYYSGIAFTRGEAPPSAGFVATFMDLNNDERQSSIGYAGATLFDQNDDGTSFIDKPWIAIDKPRPGAEQVTLGVHTDDDGIVDFEQTVECGKVYAAYARIQGDGTTAISSQIMFTKSTDCAQSFGEQIELTLPDTINQGALVAVEPLTGRIQVAWRQFENATLSCTYGDDFWRESPEAWPVDEIVIAGETYSKDDAAALFPRDGEQGGMPWLVLRRLLGAWLNALSGADRSDITETMEDAEAWLETWPPGSKPKKGDKKEGNGYKQLLDDFNKGSLGPGLCEEMVGDGMLGGLNPNAIMVVHSDDFGQTFTEPVAVTGPDYHPFEQGTTEFSFRTTAFPTMIYDGHGRSYIAYSTRGVAVPNGDPVGGDSRIVVTTSMDGTNWTVPQSIDEPTVPGHQLMPSLEHSRGYVYLLYYDFSKDISGVFDRFITDLPVDITVPRHSADVRVAQAVAADVPVFTDYSVLDQASTQASRYPYLILDNAGTPFTQQLLFNPPNLPMFKGGTVPFFGDYIDLAALHFSKDDTGNWDFDLDPALGAPVVHAVWTDNRDVQGPADGDWTNYVPPGDGTVQPSLFDPTQARPVCSPLNSDNTKMRNQNAYHVRITQGVSFELPGNNRPLGFRDDPDLGLIQRAFVSFLQNQTDTNKLFRLEILNQPEGGSASFDQFGLEIERDEVVERQSSISRSIYVSSTDVSASVDIRVTEIDETTGMPAMNGLTATATINPDDTAPQPTANNILLEEIYTPAVFNPAVFNPAVFNAGLMGTDTIGIYDPAVFNPAVFNDPLADDAEFIKAALALQSLLNPAVFNPAVFNLPELDIALWNPAVFNPAVFNPAVFNAVLAAANLGLYNPAVFNPAVFNISTLTPAVFNPAVFNPAVFNTAVGEDIAVRETSIVVENQGNTTAAYSVNLDLDHSPDGFIFQIMVYLTYLVPSAIGCDLTETVEQQALVSALSPDVFGSLLDPDSTTFNVRPGDAVVVTLRIFPDPAGPADPTTVDPLDTLSLSVVPQAVDTASLDDGEIEPPAVSILAASMPLLVIDTVALPDGQVGAAYSATLTTSGGAGVSPVTWELAPGSVMPAGLSLTAGGEIVGTPGAEGTFDVDVRARDDDQVAERSLSLTVTAGVPVVLLPPGWTPNPNGTDGDFSWDQGFGRLDSTSAVITTTDRVPPVVPLANPGWLSNEIALIDPAERYEASVYTYTADGGVGHIPAIQFFDINGGFLGTIGATGASGIIDPDNIWVQKQFFFTPASFPAFDTARTMKFIVVQDIETTLGTTTTVFFDDVVLRTNDGVAVPGPNLAPNPSFDAVNPTVNYKEQLDGDISGAFGMGPVFTLGVGTNAITGNGNGPDPVDLFDFDIYSLVIPAGHHLASITLQDWGSQSTAIVTNWRIRPCIQSGLCAFLWSVLGFNSTPATIAAQVAAIPLDLPEYTFNNSGSEVATGIPYRWIYVVEPN